MQLQSQSHNKQDELIGIGRNVTVAGSKSIGKKSMNSKVYNKKADRAPSNKQSVGKKRTFKDLDIKDDDLDTPFPIKKKLNSNAAKQ